MTQQVRFLPAWFSRKNLRLIFNILSLLLKQTWPHLPFFPSFISRLPVTKLDSINPLYISCLSYSQIYQRRVKDPLPRQSLHVHFSMLYAAANSSVLNLSPTIHPLVRLQKAPNKIATSHGAAKDPTWTQITKPGYLH